MKKNNIPKLTNAVNDAKELAKVLKNIGFDNIIELYDNKATKKEILSLIYNKLSKEIDKNDRLLFFYSGHGLTYTTKRNKKDVGYIVPYDGDIDKISLIEFVDIVDKGIENISAKHVLFLMDCCFSGISALRNINEDKISILSMPLDDYIDHCIKDNTIQIITAGGKLESVLDSSIYSGHSPFTGSIIYGLKTGDADLNKDGVITSTELGAYLLRNVSDVSNIYNHKQKPVFNRLPGDEGGEFIIMITKKNIETLDEFRVKVSKLSLTEKISVIKNKTKSTNISLIDNEKNYCYFLCNLY